MARDPGTPTPTVPSTVPPAVRSSPPGWRDPRLWVGVAIVAASVLVGSRVLAAADDTVQVWAVADGADPGVRLTEDDLVAQRLRFADAGGLGRYFEVGDELPADLTVLHAIGPGDLLPRSAVGAADDEGTVTLSLGVGPLLVPTAIGPGSVVDVYVTGDPAVGGTATGGPGRGRTDDSAPAVGEPVLDDVRVVAAPPPGETTSPTGERQVELAVPRDDVAAYYALVGSLTTPVVSLTQES